MNKDFGCYCGFLADMIMKYAPEIKDAYNIDTLQQCRVFFYYRKFIGSPPCKREYIWHRTEFGLRMLQIH